MKISLILYNLMSIPIVWWVNICKILMTINEHEHPCTRVHYRNNVSTDFTRKNISKMAAHRFRNINVFRLGQKILYSVWLSSLFWTTRVSGPKRKCLVLTKIGQTLQRKGHCNFVYFYFKLFIFMYTYRYNNTRWFNRLCPS